MLSAKATLEVHRGDLLVIETPGGGEWGASPANDEKRNQATELETIR